MRIHIDRRTGPHAFVLLQKSNETKINIMFVIRYFVRAVYFSAHTLLLFFSPFILLLFFCPFSSFFFLCVLCMSITSLHCQYEEEMKMEKHRAFLSVGNGPNCNNKNNNENQWSSYCLYMLTHSK